MSASSWILEFHEIRMRCEQCNIVARWKRFNNETNSLEPGFNNYAQINVIPFREEAINIAILCTFQTCARGQILTP